MQPPRAAKLRRLNEFRRSKPHCTASALAAILADVRDNGLPEVIDRNSMRAARDAVTTTVGQYGPILQSFTCIDAEEEPTSIPIASPFASLAAAVEESANFRKFLNRQLMLHPSTPEKPWNLILYSDEVTPGNPLSPANKRKFQSIYWSFLEFGVSALSHEESWFVLMTEFSCSVNSLSAGLSQAFAEVIKSFFKPDGFHFQDGGMALDLDGDSFRLFAKVGVVLQDGGAHKAVWQARGDGASKFCMLCKNMFTADSRVVDEDGSAMLRCNEIHLDELVASTDHELRTNARYLERMSRTLSNDEFVLLQQALGLTFAKRGLLLDRALDRLVNPTEVFMHDNMHALFVDGVVNLVIYLTFEEFISAGLNGVWESFSEFLANWAFPGRFHATHLDAIFNADRKDKHRKAQHLKCQASDLLTILGVLMLFTQTVLRPMGAANAACDAMIACVELSQLVVATSRIDVSPARLLGCVHKFLEYFTAAFGYESLTPKCHWLLHFPELLERNGRLLNCFALERKHRMPKRYATELANISGSASKSLLSECVAHHLSSITSHSFTYDVGLVQGRNAPKKSRQLILDALGLEGDDIPVNVGKDSRFSQLGLCTQGDVVLLNGPDGILAARVKLHVEVSGEAVSMMEVMELSRRIPGTAKAVWKLSETPVECWETKAILAAVEHCVYADGTVGTILPLEFS